MPTFTNRCPCVNQATAPASTSKLKSADASYNESANILVDDYVPSPMRGCDALYRVMDAQELAIWMISSEALISASNCTSFSTDPKAISLILDYLSKRICEKACEGDSFAALKRTIMIKLFVVLEVSQFRDNFTFQDTDANAI